MAWGPQSHPTPCPGLPSHHPLPSSPPLTPGCSGASGLRMRPRPREVTRAQAHRWAWLRLEPGLLNPTLASPSRCPGQSPGRPHMAPASRRPLLLTQHAHGVQPGVLPRRVVGHAGVGARVRGHQALQHQGAAVQVEAARGGGAGSRCVRGGPLPPGRGGHRPGLTGGGGPRPGPAGGRPSARPPRAVAAHQLRSPAAPPAPPGRCAPVGHPRSGSGGPLRQGLW